MKTIPLTLSLFAMVDDADYDRLSQYTWQADKRGNLCYAKRWKKNANGHITTTYMHREVFGISGRICVDHADHNGLNNQRSNLRICSYSQNLQNMRPRKGKSKYKGVYATRCRNWVAQIRLKGRGKHLGTFEDEADAARAYDAAARLYFGEYAFCNNSDDREEN